MELAGSLKQFAVANILQFLAMESSTGILTLTRGREKIIIALSKGDVVDVEHSKRTKEERKERILGESGRIDQEGFWKAAEESRSKLKTIGAMLVERGVLTDLETNNLSALVCTDILFEALKWRDGVYEFERKPKTESDELARPMSLQSILLNAAQQEDEWPQIRRYVPSLETVFIPSHIAEGTGDSTQWDSILRQLTPEDRRIAEHIDGINGVSAIVGATLRSEFEVCRLLMELFRRRLVTTVVRKRERHEAYPQGFLSASIGRGAFVPLVLVLAGLLLFFMWRHYLEPLLTRPGVVLAPIIEAGRDPATVNLLRLNRLEKAFQLYRSEYGGAPPSLAVMVRLGYCSRDDLHSTTGGPFTYKVIGSQGERIIIQATDGSGRPDPQFHIEMTLPDFKSSPAADVVNNP